MATLETLTRRELLTLAVAGALTMLTGSARGTESTDASPLRRAIPHGRERLPALGLGTWQQFDLAPGDAGWDDARATLVAALAAGVRAIDTSPMYGRAEAAVGALLAEVDPKREAFVATKVWTSGRAKGREQIERSFKLLQRERIDLIQVHNLLDLDTHLDTLRALKREGRVRYVGVTHYTASAHDALVDALGHDGVDFVQVNYSLAEREAERTVLPAAQRRGVAVLVNRPFAEGDLFRRIGRAPLPPLAAELGCASWAQYALKWIVGHPAVTCAIPGTRKVDHLLDNVAAMHGVQPDADQRARMAEVFDRLG